jgi:hypothetical protein
LAKFPHNWTLQFICRLFSNISLDEGVSVPARAGWKVCLRHPLNVVPSTLKMV